MRVGVRGRGGRWSASCGGAAVAAIACLWAASPGASASITFAEAGDCAPPVVGLGVGEGRNDPAQFPPTVGELRLAMLFVEFADVRSSADPREAYETFVPGAAEWYRRVSYDRLQLNVTPVSRRVLLRGTVADYRTGGGAGPEAGFRAAVEETLAALDADVDFSRFHALYLVLPFASLQTVGASSVVILERPVRADGAEFRAIALMYDGAGAAPEYLVHETGHILGLPDLYVVGSPESFHRWDVMTGRSPPRGLFAWHLWKLGWLEPAQIVCFSSGRRAQATLTPLERPGGTKAIIVLRGRRAYVVEARRPVPAGRRRVCPGGVLVYEVEFGAAIGVADIRIRRARFDTSYERIVCGPTSGASLGRGRGRISSLRAFGLRFQVLAALRDGSFRVRVTKAK
jgi:M6 family metalloprotease-like protein